MTASGHSIPSKHPVRLRFTPVIAGAKRAGRQHPILIAAAVLVLWGGGVAGWVAGLNSASDVQAAGRCPVTGGYYAYAVPDDPAHPPAAGSGATSWGWTPRKHQVRIGDRMRLNGRLWQVTEIATMPGVEPVGRPFYIISWPMPGQHLPGNTSLTMCGRLVFRPVS
jgi:hypothetical protein